MMDENEQLIIIDNNPSKSDLLESDAPYDATHLSDVIEAIKDTDPDFRHSIQIKQNNEELLLINSSNLHMLNGGGQVQQQQSERTKHHSYHAEVKIVEQPASKALRFRYECEGRSAGSIPGAHSTPENKTFPEIQICGSPTKAAIVVSCVTKDEPYLPHPHNLVGKECKNGVCTVMVSSDNMRVQFQNLGIQCVKRRDIESSLKLREHIKVDPFRQGYAHRNQPTSIDLNAVRLCFQTYLEDANSGKFIKPLRPIVSDIIYDKKAMADLSIDKLCGCVTPVDGGNTMMLFCEKVAKEDIEIHFFEEDPHSPGHRIWQAKAEFQPSDVHKQTGIAFKTPPYRTLDIIEPVRVFIQLYRPSDGKTSEARPFDYLPLDAGRTPYWSFKRRLAKKSNYKLFDSILTKTSDDIKPSSNNNYAEVKKTNNNPELLVLEEKSFNEIINQVAELDEIYSDTRHVNDKVSKKLSEEESFDDARTYTSLQLAFKNPVDVIVSKKVPSLSPVSGGYEDVVSSVAPSISKSPALPPKRDNDHILPPLPPKRTKKLETYIGDSISSIPLTGRQADIFLTRSGSMKSQSVSRSQSFKNELAAPAKRLPPVPPSYSVTNSSAATLPNPKKRSFLSKLFGRHKCSKQSLVASSKPPSRETSVSPSYRSLQVDHLLSKSSGNISTHSTNSIRIRLKDDSPPTPNCRNSNLTYPSATSSEGVFSNNNKTDSVKVKSVSAPSAATALMTNNEDLDLQLDLTEAENYALYTSMAPHATQSEFDEFSCYYAPVEGGKILTNAEIAARFMAKMRPHHSENYKRKRPKFEKLSYQKSLEQISSHQQDNRLMGMNSLEPIKIEPRDSTSPYSLGAGPSPNTGLYNFPEHANYTYNQNQHPDSNLYSNNFNVPLQPTKPNNCNENFLIPSLENPNNISWNVHSSLLEAVAAAASANSAAASQQGPNILDLDKHQIQPDILQKHLNNIDVEPLIEFNSLNLSDMEFTASSQTNMSDNLSEIVNAAAEKHIFNN